MSSGGQTVTQENEPWGPAQGFIQQGMQQAQNVYNSGTGQQYFPISTVVPFSNQSETALQAMEGRALQGNPLNQVAGQTLTDVMQGQTPSANYWGDVVGGNYLNGQGQNPYLDQTFNRMADQVQSRVNAQMGLAGRTNSGAHQDLLTDNLGDLANQVYGQNYQIERDRQQQAAGALDQYTGRQLQAAGMAPSLAQQDYYDIDRLMQAGQSREALGNAYMEDLINRWNFSQQAPWNALNNFQNIALGVGSLGGQASTTQPTSWQSALGSGLGGAAQGFALGGPVGGILGGLGGILGGL